MVIVTIVIISCMPRLTQKVFSKSLTNLEQTNFARQQISIYQFYQFFLYMFRAILHIHRKARQCMYTESAIFRLYMWSRLLFIALSRLLRDRVANRNLRTFRQQFLQSDATEREIQEKCNFFLPSYSEYTTNVFDVNHKHTIVRNYRYCTYL